MDIEEYRKRGKEMVDYIADYLTNIRQRRVFPNVKPGYMRELVPDHAPEKGEPWENIFNDIERVIMPGVTHWQSPYMHGYFPSLNSPPSLLGDMLSDGITCLGFTWAASPASTELETIVLDWLAKALALPEHFLHSNQHSRGGGVIQTTTSEGTLVALLAARSEMIRLLRHEYPDTDDCDINARLVAYCSDQAHSSVEKAGLIGMVKMHYVDSDDDLSMRGWALKEAMDRDREKGLIPFYVCATLGTTGAVAFDNLLEVGEICERFSVWLHVDAAYAGSSFICPEYRHWLRGIEYADSIVVNTSKWMMVNFDCSCLWVKNSSTVHHAFNVEPLYLQHENSGYAVDFMHWQVGLSRRFRSLKLWFVLRNYGVAGIQDHIRRSVHMAEIFESLVQADKRFEIPAKRHLGVVVFRLKGPNATTEKLLKRLNVGGKLHCVPAAFKGKYVIRYVVTSTHTNEKDILRDWEIICQTAGELAPHRITLAELKKQDPEFGSSLLLSNSPMTPKVVNGSYVALFEGDEALRQLVSRYSNKFSLTSKESPELRRRVRRFMLSQKQLSLDSRMDLVNSLIASSRGLQALIAAAICDKCVDAAGGSEDSCKDSESIAEGDEDSGVTTAQKALAAAGASGAQAGSCVSCSRPLARTDSRHSE
ncbi:histidine decarboxylase [Dermacentor andersoni]|uniref:histidine decarboxylase n=1 Tax=Dermacentor andersoni TaxID=34620 RepID=UPI002417F7ED|nr:histidine decarboxylase-like [Dermacentor andersoni]